MESEINKAFIILKGLSDFDQIIIYQYCIVGLYREELWKIHHQRLYQKVLKKVIG